LHGSGGNVDTLRRIEQDGQEIKVTLGKTKSTRKERPQKIKQQRRNHLSKTPKGEKEIDGVPDAQFNRAQPKRRDFTPKRKEGKGKNGEVWGDKGE